MNVFEMLFNYLNLLPKNKHTRDLYFSKWLINIVVKFLLFPIFCLFLFFYISGIKWTLYLKNIFHAPLDNRLFYSIAAQIIFIFLVILFPVKPRLFKIEDNKKACENEDLSDQDKSKSIANDALVDYRTKWYTIWISWLLLYIILLFQNIEKAPGFIYKFFESIPFSSETFQAVLTFLLNLFNNIATLIFILCYITLAKVTVSETNYRSIERASWFPWFTIFCIFTLIDGITQLSNSVRIFDFFLFFKDIFANILGISSSNIELLPVFSGIIAGTVMAMFIGRFDSKFIKAPIPLLIALYAYAVLQALFFILKDPIETLIIINAAFIFKVLLFLFMTWLFKSGKMLFYFVRIRKLHCTVDKEYNEFLDDYRQNEETESDLDDEEDNTDQGGGKNQSKEDVKHDEKKSAGISR